MYLKSRCTTKGQVTKKRDSQHKGGSTLSAKPKVRVQQDDWSSQKKQESAGGTKLLRAVNGEKFEKGKKSHPMRTGKRGAVKIEKGLTTGCVVAKMT